MTCDVVRLQVRLGRTRVTLRAIAHDNVNTHIYTPGLVQVADFLRSHNVKLADDYKSDNVTDVGLIIGADHYSKFDLSLHKCANVQLLSCSAGSVIFGPLPRWAAQLKEVATQPVRIHYSLCSRVTTFDSDLAQIPNLWKLDIVGIISEPYSPEEKLALDKFDKSLEYNVETQQYSVDFPFRSNSLHPPLNYRKAFGQLMSLKRAIEHNPGLFKQYHGIFLDYMSRGFIEVASDQLQGHYLPYHGVRNLVQLPCVLYSMPQVVSHLMGCP